MRRLLPRLVCMGALLLPAALAAQTGIDGAYALLGEGRVQDGRTALMEASAALAPSAAVPHLKVARVLGKVGPELAPRVARAVADAYRGRSSEAIVALLALEADARPEEMPPLLALSADLADGTGDGAQAEALRVRLIEAFPEATERPAAILEVAEARARRGQDVDQAIAWVEALIVEQPDGALVPEARRVLDRLRSAG